jgi:tRNA splicing endonuclease
VQGFATLVLPPFHHFQSDIPAELPTAYTGRISVDCESEYDVAELLYAVYCHLKVRGDWVCDGSNFGADFSVYRSRPGSDHSIVLAWCQDGDADARKVAQDVGIAERVTKKAIMAVGALAGVRHVNIRKVKAERDRFG